MEAKEMTTKPNDNKPFYISALKRDNADLTKMNQELMKKYTVKTSDPVTNDVIDRIFKRHIQGMEKFKVTMADNPKSIDEWIEESIEEKIDDICYMVTLKSRIDKAIKDLKDKIKEAGRINQLHQELCKDLKKRAEEAEGENTIIKGIGNNSPEIRTLQKENKLLKTEQDILRDDLQLKDLEMGKMMDKINGKKGNIRS